MTLRERQRDLQVVPVARIVSRKDLPLLRVLIMLNGISTYLNSIGDFVGIGIRGDSNISAGVVKFTLFFLLTVGWISFFW